MLDLTDMLSEDVVLLPDKEQVMAKANGRASILYAFKPPPFPHLGTDHAIATALALRERGCAITVLLDDTRLKNADAVISLWKAYLVDACRLDAAILLTSDLRQEPGFWTVLSRGLRLNAVGDNEDVLPREVRSAKKAAALVDYVAPVLQCADAQFIAPDVVMIDVTNRKFYALLQNLGGPVPAFIYLPTAHNTAGLHIDAGVQGHRNAKRICLLETPGSLAIKMRDVFAPPAGAPAHSERVDALAELVRFSVLPWRHCLTIPGADGRVHEIKTFNEYQEGFLTRLFHPMDVKKAAQEALLQRFERQRKSFSEQLLAHIDLDRALGFSSGATAEAS